jgi:hypothetical protein
MADKARYPQIPSTVWWGIRSILRKTPTIVVDERVLSVQLNVQPVAARQYIAELKSIGMLTDENRATPLAIKWRLDETYAAAVDELTGNVYPESLRSIAPPGQAERQKVVTWFLHEGLGHGAAGNKAATYLLLSSATPNEAPNSRSNQVQTTGEPNRPQRQSSKAIRTKRTEVPAPLQDQDGDRKSIASRDSFPLNVNVQIHISADAGSEQIESIFSAMKRYLYDNQST